MARKTIQEFVEQAQQVRGDRFYYSEMEYVNTHTFVEIRCKECELRAIKASYKQGLFQMQ